jgi:hypothetical protein
LAVVADRGRFFAGQLWIDGHPRPYIERQIAGGIEAALREPQTPANLRGVVTVDSVRGLAILLDRGLKVDRRDPVMRAQIRAAYIAGAARELDRLGPNRADSPSAAS